MDTRPVIGITGYITEPNRGIGLRQTYIDSVFRAGGLPVILPIVEDQALASDLLSHIDALILSGGGDVDPARYGHERRPECGESAELRDTSELMFAQLARQSGMPIFGICRGVQVLNVAYGGTLIQDIESQHGIPRRIHRQDEPYDHLVHSVNLTENGLLHRITGMKKIMTNSMHHQAADKLGGTLILEGASEEGIIEAVSDSENPSVFGVQFHPEFFSGQHEYAQKLFDYFVKQAREYAVKK